VKTQKNNREVGVGEKREPYLGDALEFLSEEVQEELMALTDLAIALENERMRLDVIESDDKIPLDEVRVVYALLRVLCERLDGLSKNVDKVRACFRGVMREHDLIPSIAETWARSDSRPTTCNPSTSGSSSTRKRRANNKGANHFQEHGPATGANEF
jgi:hypothetical protein